MPLQIRLIWELRWLISKKEPFISSRGVLVLAHTEDFLVFIGFKALLDAPFISRNAFKDAWLVFQCNALFGLRAIVVAAKFMENAFVSIEKGQDAAVIDFRPDGATDDDAHPIFHFDIQSGWVDFIFGSSPKGSMRSVSRTL
ncbi:hypothetical protein IM774_08430 [Erysipelotrichaceae bacterium RD49]|nr:hypothetical protein [Erysipelotrichaceae bacterium RD49]